MWFGALVLAGGALSALRATPASSDPVIGSSTGPTITTSKLPEQTGGRWVTISGRGFGHGVGMAQDGAYWMGRQGRSSAEILRHFYPGTSLGTRGGNVRVPLGGASVVTLRLEDGGSVGGRRIARGDSVTVRPIDGELVVTIDSGTDRPAETPGENPGENSAAPAPVLAMRPISFQLQTPPATIDPSATTSSASPVGAPGLAPPAAVTPTAAEPPPVTAAPPVGSAPTVPTEPALDSPPLSGTSVPPSSVPANEPVDTLVSPPKDSIPASGNTETLRGNPLVVAAAPGGTVAYAGRRYRGTVELRAQGGVRVVNELDVEQYLRGMGEVTDPRWPAAALEAQAIAARTYAFRTMASAGEVCPTQRCQVYVGVKAEYGAMDKAVTATRGKVVTYAKGKLAVTFYSASGGGTIATPEEAFGGTGNFPYLQAGTYPTGDLKSWVVTMSIDEIGRRVGYGASASRIDVTRVGPSGRAIEVTILGSGPPLVLPGPRFDAALGLRSTLFTLQQSNTRPTIDPAGGVDVLDEVPATNASPGTNNGTESSSEQIVFSQSGFFDAPATPDGSPTTEVASTADIASPRATVVESAATDPPTTSMIPSPGQATQVLRKPQAVTSESNRTSEVVFIGVLTFAGATLFTGARRWLRARRPRH